MNHLTRASTLVLLPFLLATACLAQAEENAVPSADTRTPTVFEDVETVRHFQATITAEELAAHLYLFASDFFEGRETTTRGQRLAAHYLASQYKDSGLAPYGTVASDDPRAPERYFQPFPLTERRFQEAKLSRSLGGENERSERFTPETFDGSFYVSSGSDGTFDGGVVFAGYGIAAPELGYDDYAALQEAGIDPAGKWLLVLRDEPLASAEESLLPTENGEPSRWTTHERTKGFAARQYAARGLLIVGDAGPRASVSFADQVARSAAQRARVGSLSLPTDQGASPTYASMPIIYVSTEWANALLAPSGLDVETLRTRINSSVDPLVFETDDARVSVEIAYEERQSDTENVVAYLEGSDPVLKDEFVILTSHYDHVGVNPALDGDQVYNGADDDGSGTVAILEIAEAFVAAAEQGYRPRRSILFLNVSGEERGLLGSAWFADREPLVPLDRVVTNLNMDMVGRFDPTHPSGSENYVYIIGSNLISQELHDINAKVNEMTGVSLELDERFNSPTDPNQFYRRSDHWSFGKHGIPFIFFFTGTHEDYHQPGDEADKIAYERMARIAQLVFATTWQVANQDSPPAVTGSGFF